MAGSGIDLDARLSFSFLRLPDAVAAPVAPSRNWRRPNDEMSPDEFIFHLETLDTYVADRSVPLDGNSDYALTDSLRVGISAGSSCCTSSEYAIVTPIFAR
jgi:hypothetical protein